MRSPADMTIIQAEFTDACESHCGGCTRLSPHVTRPFFMSQQQLEKALESLQGWQGRIVGAMGGNPVLHPAFERMAHAFAANWGRKTLATNGRQPIADFSAYAMERLSDQSSGRGLWSSLGAGYYRHYETIQAVFDYQCLNDHYNNGLHQGLLIGRKEFCETNGITDDQWLEARQNCWVQQSWSASINPHGAYFCEVAAAIDNVFFGGKSAWPVESGWWKRTPKDFNDQLHLCDHCALAQKGPSVVANEDKDIIGKLSLPMVQATGSRVVKNQTYEVYDAKNPEHQNKGRDFRVDWYMPEPHMRVSPENDSVKPKKLSCVIVCVGYADKLRHTLPHNAKLVDEIVVVTTPDDFETIKALQCEQSIGVPGQIIFEHPKNLKRVLSDACYDENASFNKGKMLNVGLAALDRPDWCLLTDADVFLHPKTLEFVKSHALNPGCLYGTWREDMPSDAKFIVDCNGRASWTRTTPGVIQGVYCYQTKPSDDINDEPNGYFQLFNLRASALQPHRQYRDTDTVTFSSQGPNTIMPEVFCSAGGIDTWLLQRFPEDKRIMLPDIPVVHISHGEFGANWNGLQPRSGPRWRQLGMITQFGFFKLCPQMPKFSQVRLVDTKDAHAVELPLTPGEPFPLDLVKITKEGIVFDGRNVGHCHLHVSYLEEE